MIAPKISALGQERVDKACGQMTEQARPTRAAVVKPQKRPSQVFLRAEPGYEHMPAERPAAEVRADVGEFHDQQNHHHRLRRTLESMLLIDECLTRSAIRNHARPPRYNIAKTVPAMWVMASSVCRPLARRIAARIITNTIMKASVEAAMCWNQGNCVRNA